MDLVLCRDVCPALLFLTTMTNLQMKTIAEIPKKSDITQAVL